MSLGERIAKLRKLHNWTQTDLAEKAGIHAAHISRLEKDKMRPKATTLKRLAEVLEVSLDEMLDRDDEQPELHDAELLRSFRYAQELEAEDKRMIIRMVQALLTRKRLQFAIDL